MNRLLSICTVLALTFVGCAKETETKTTVSTPEGETTKTETTTVEKSGENPPATPGTPQ